MFKIGDKVRRRNEFIDRRNKATSGEVVTVRFIGSNEYFTVKEDGGATLWNPDCFELVEAHKMTQNQPHKHAELIKVWADGAEIEFWDIVDETWKLLLNPSWSTKTEYRLKPIKKPDIVRKMFVEACPTLDNAYNQPNLELTFDPDSGVLKAAKVL